MTVVHLAAGRSDSNLATKPRASNSNRLTGSVGEQTAPSMIKRAQRLASFSPLSVALRNDRARRSSFVTTSASPGWRAASTESNPG